MLTRPIHTKAYSPSWGGEETRFCSSLSSNGQRTTDITTLPNTDVKNVLLDYVVFEDIRYGLACIYNHTHARLGHNNLFLTQKLIQITFLRFPARFIPPDKFSPEQLFTTQDTVPSYRYEHSILEVQLCQAQHMPCHLAWLVVTHQTPIFIFLWKWARAESTSA